MNQRDAKQWKALFAVLLAAITVGAYWRTSIHGWQAAAGPGDEFGLEFRYLGCDDGLPDRLPENLITSTVNLGSVTYHVTDLAACGYSVRNPTYELTGGTTLQLSYELFTESDMLPDSASAIIPRHPMFFSATRAISLCGMELERRRNPRLRPSRLLRNEPTGMW